MGVQPHTGDDSLCVIRQFPYTEDFETAPTCWEATSSNSDYSYSWMVADSTGVDGNYSTAVFRSYYGNCRDHLFSPAIVIPGNYKVSWQARAYSTIKSDSYTLDVDTVSFSDTLNTTDWQTRELLFTVAAGDTVRLDFGHVSSTRSGGVLIDNVIIETVTAPDPVPDPDPDPDPDTVGIDNASVFPLHIYPNPASDVLYIASGEDIQRIELFDVSGRMVECVNVGMRECPSGTNTLTQIQINTLPAGVYILRCVTPSTVTVQRVVKK